MTPDERRAYSRAWRLANKDKLDGYKAKQKAAARARYLRNSDKIIAQVREYQAKNYEAHIVRSRASNAKRAPLIRSRVETCKRMFGLLPEEAREEYAQWLLFLADVDTSYGNVVRTPSLDYNFIAEYAGV